MAPSTNDYAFKRYEVFRLPWKGCQFSMQIYKNTFSANIFIKLTCIDTLHFDCSIHSIQ